MSEEELGILFVIIMLVAIGFVFFKIIVNERKEKNRKRPGKY